jgi:hypothetical protein
VNVENWVGDGRVKEWVGQGGVSGQDGRRGDGEGVGEAAEVESVGGWRCSRSTGHHGSLLNWGLGIGIYVFSLGSRGKVGWWDDGRGRR